MRIDLPNPVKEILSRLRKQNFEAYIVGGCVRDSILGKSPEDWDITTNARPDEIIKLFPKTLETGLKHGTVTVILNRIAYEVTTFRIDGKYSDGRHPDQVKFTKKLYEDLRRRDFTINAMAYAEETGLEDKFGGMKDLKDKVIRCVGEARERFMEDALRMLRAIRFSAQLDFSIAEETRRAITELSLHIQKVSKERIFVELTKLLISANPEKVEDIFCLGLASNIVDGFEEIKQEDCQALVYAKKLSNKKYLRYSALMRNLEPKQAVQILQGLRSDKDTIIKVQTLITYAKLPVPQNKVEIKKVLYEIGVENFRDYLELYEYGFTKEKKTICVQQLRAWLDEIIIKEEPYDLKKLAVGGRDLIAIGIQPGPKLREILENLLLVVMENPSYNNKEKLLKSLMIQ